MDKMRNFQSKYKYKQIGFKAKFIRKYIIRIQFNYVTSVTVKLGSKHLPQLLIDFHHDQPYLLLGLHRPSPCSVAFDHFVE